MGGFLRKCDKGSDDCEIRDVRDMDMEEKGLCEEAKGRVGRVDPEPAKEVIAHAT